MKNLFQKFRTWYRGQTEYSVGQQIGRHADNRTRSVKLPPIPPEFDPPLFARILNPVGRFWHRNWKILLPVIVGALVVLFTHFDSKTDRKTPQKTERVPSVQTGKQ